MFFREPMVDSVERCSCAGGDLLAERVRALGKRMLGRLMLNLALSGSWNLAFSEKLNLGRSGKWNFDLSGKESLGRLGRFMNFGLSESEERILSMRLGLFSALDLSDLPPLPFSCLCRSENANVGRWMFLRRERSLPACVFNFWGRPRAPRRRGSSSNANEST